MWVPPAPGLRTRLSNINRMRQVLQAFVRHGFRSLVDQLGFSDRALVDPKPDALASARIGRRLALVLGELGPTFVKLGQLLATRDDLLPAAVTTELATLQDRVKPMAEAEVRAQVERALGKPVGALFASFDPSPLAAASIGQVHRAKTRDGRDVVVKVQRPGIADTIADDLALLDQLAELLEIRVEESRRFDPKGLARAFGEGLKRELDFRLEAAAYRRMREAIGSTGRLPGVVEELTCETVLTLDFVEGHKVTTVADPVVRRILARRILRTFIHQVLHAGYFHADPHAGNLLSVQGGQDIALLDLGAVGTIDRETRATLIRLAAAASARDGRAFARVLLDMVDHTDPIDHPAYEADVQGFLQQLLARNLREVALSEITGRLFEIVRDHGLRARAQYFTLVRAVTILDGLLRELDPAMDPLRSAAPHILAATVVNGDLVPAATLAGSMVRARWRRDPRFRVVLVAGPAVMVLAIGLALVWLIAG